MEFRNYFDSSSESETYDVLNSSSSSSDWENTLDLFNDEPERIQNFEHIIEQYSENQFKNNFRLSRSSILLIIDEFKKSVIVYVGLTSISPEMQVYITVWYLANQQTFREVSEQFGYDRSMIYKCVSKVSRWIVTQLSTQYLTWPDQQQRKIIESEFKKKNGISNIIGAIDSSHIRIQAPSQFAVQFFNRKQFYSLHLQAVVDDRKMFTDICVGEPGSIHDSRVLRKSKLFENLQSNCSNYMNQEQIILGDLAYPSSFNWLVPPFKDYGNLTDSHKKFNYLHSSSRIIVEQAFGLLKGRFRRLRGFDNINLNFVKILISAAVVLHNICILRDDYWFENFDELAFEEDDQQTDQNIDHHNHSTRRDMLYTQLLDLGIL